MSNDIRVTDGTAVYNETDDKLGIITGASEDGFTVTVVDAVEYVETEATSEEIPPENAADQAEAPSEGTHDISSQEHDPGQEFGEGYIMWRCEECGEMGKLDEGFPDECPNCGSADVYKYKED